MAGMAKRRKKPERDPDAATPCVGTSAPRAEGFEKVTGRARYIDDLHFDGMIHGATVRADIACGRLVVVERDPSFDWTGFTFVEAKDIARLGAGKNVVTLLTDDQPYLAHGVINHREEPVALLAHADRARLQAGLARVRVVCEPSPAVLDLEAATFVQKLVTIEKGDLDAGFAAAEVVVEGEYRTGAQEHVYIETNGVIAVPGAPGHDEGVTLYGSLQCPYYVHKALRGLLGLPESAVRVVQATTGGGFGGKEEYPSVLAGHAALLARASGRPVKMIYDRTEDMVATTKRHPSIVRHKTGLLRDGTITAMEIDLRLDGGAYVTLSPVVLSRSALHASGPYRIPNARIRARSLKTNTPPTGAFRGFGAPQSQFAVEVHMDRIADALGLDPIALRRKNLLRAGDTTATGQLLRDSVSCEVVLDRALALAASQKDLMHRTNRDGKLRGTGVSVFFHGSGFTGAGEVRLASKAGLKLTEGGVRVLVASTEIGQGTRTMLAQIVADTLGLPYAFIETADPDTAEVPDSGPTVASRTCMIVGGILQRAAKDLTDRLGAWADPAEFREKARAYLATHGELVCIAQYEKPADIVWDDERYRGDAYGAFAWGANVAEVEVDPVTWEARCARLVSSIDVGRAINPLLVAGQVEGGALQAVGWALCEEVVMRGGRMANAQLTNYIIPTTLDAPEQVVDLVENPYRHGPFGAKGVGEAPMDGPASAIVNAIRAATGLRLSEIPATPERICAAMTARDDVLPPAATAASA